jgi:hypothetical protein
MDTPPATAVAAVPTPATDDSVLLKPKTKREKTEKQKAVWDKACETRINNAKLKKEALAKAKEEIENKKNKKSTDTDLAVIEKPTKAKPKVVYESDSEPEVVVVKKKKKQIVYEEESSEDEAPPPPPKKAKAPVVVAPAPKTPIVRFF